MRYKFFVRKEKFRQRRPAYGRGTSCKAEAKLSKASAWMASPLHQLHVAVRNAMEWASAKGSQDSKASM